MEKKLGDLQQGQRRYYGDESQFQAETDAYISMARVENGLSAIEVAAGHVRALSELVAGQEGELHQQMDQVDGMPLSWLRPPMATPAKWNCVRRASDGQGGREGREGG